MQDPDLTQEVLEYIATRKGRGSRYIFEKFVKSYPQYLNHLAAFLAYNPEFVNKTIYLIGQGANNYYEILQNSLEIGNEEIVRYILQEKPRFLTEDEIYQLLYGLVVTCALPPLQFLLRYISPTAEMVRELIKIIPQIENTQCDAIIDLLESLLPEVGRGSDRRLA